MCGIYGYMKKDEPNGTLNSMAYAMDYRGPDAIGNHRYNNLNIGYVRLSIIDVRNGNQPFISDDQKIVVFQNGEIYNFRELQHQLTAKGHTFKTHCDTEVLLKGYLEWGWETLLQKIDGMFAISILDKNLDTLFIARDRYGEKPLYYYKDSESFVYSSTLRSMKECDWINFDLSQKAIQSYLYLHYIPWGESIFNNIYKLLPGHYIKYDVNNNFMSIHKYYSIDHIGDNEPNEKYLDDLLEEEVSKRCFADVPVGIFLSGGLDSSLITYYATKNNTNVNTFSIGFEDSNLDESKYSSYVANFLKTNHHHFTFTNDLFTNLFEDLLLKLDEPIGDPAILPTYFLSLQARKHAKVVLSGEGGDEIFGGYSYYKHLPEKVFKDNGLFRYDLKTTTSGFSLIAPDRYIKALTGKDLKDSLNNEPEFLSKLNSINNNIDKAMYTDTVTWLPDDLLVKLDKATMAASIEGRAPYLSRKVVEYGMSIKHGYKFDKVNSKKILQNIAVKYLPEFIVYRQKQGFILPMKQWLGKYLENINIVEWLFESKIQYINPDVASMLLVESKLSQIPDPRFIFSLVMLLKWYEKFMQK